MFINVLLMNEYFSPGQFQHNQVAQAISIHSMGNGTTHYLLHSSHVHDVRMRISFITFERYFHLAAYACFCNPCFTAQLTQRAGDHILTCCVNPFTLMAIRTKVRTAYKIEVSINKHTDSIIKWMFSLNSSGKSDRRLLHNNMLCLSMCCDANWKRTEWTWYSRKTRSIDNLSPLSNNILSFSFFFSQIKHQHHEWVHIPIEFQINNDWSEYQWKMSPFFFLFFLN